MQTTKSLEEEYGKPLSPERLEEITQRVTGVALLLGIQRTVKGSGFPEVVEPWPLTLFPSKLPAEILEKAKSLQQAYQTLMYKVANDHEFLKESLKGVLNEDDFTKQLWDIYETVTAEGATQEISIVLTRNDFMTECTGEEKGCKQVELNTFASGGGGDIINLVAVHKYSLTLADIPFEEKRLPENNPTAGQARGLVKAWQLYNNKSAVVLFVVGIPESSKPDHRSLEMGIFKIDKSIKVIYRTFQQLIEQMSLGENKELIVDEREVAIVYYRWGYSPKHYPSDKEYKLRLDIERSRAIKCPTVAFHLAGCKKIQQVLAQPGVLERFIKDADMIENIRSTFVGLYSLDDPDSNKVIMEALKTPERFVLKPQREGGGNNLFGNDLKHHLEKIKESPERSAWILMDRIRATVQRNRLIRVGIGPEIRDVISEIGIFGVHISKPTAEVENYECGHLIRTKPVEANEGGLCEGLACFDSPYLV